jgi:hypothetical protein
LQSGGYVYQFTKPSDAVQLVRWNKELPSASAADPLGLNLRVSARLANELLHCITSITPRARYYSFFPWAFEDYRDNEHGTSKDRGRIQGVLARERAMVLGAVLHWIRGNALPRVRRFRLIGCFVHCHRNAETRVRSCQLVCTQDRSIPAEWRRRREHIRIICGAIFPTDKSGWARGNHRADWYRNR